MSEDIYAKPDFTKKVRFQKGEKEDKDACDDINNVTIYDNCWAEESTDKPQDNTEDKPQDKPQDTTTEDQQQTASVSVSSEKKNLFKVSLVLLGLLCLLLVAVIVLVVLFIMETNQLLVDNANLINERHQQQTRLTEMENLNANLTNERDQLQTSFSEMETLNHNLTQNMSQLENERDRLYATNSNLTNIITELRKQIETTCCPEKWTRFGENCYFMSNSKKSWTDSSEVCERNGAQLVIISSQEEQQFLSSFKQSAWIGLTDEEKEDNWKWVDGSEMTIKYWREDQPDDGGPFIVTEDCAEISAIDNIKNWNDLKCKTELYFICEKKRR